MHPAYSVILFTTLSGGGYGLLICLATLALLDAVPPSPLLGLVGLGLAFAMILGGLLSSTLHLGRPKRAWRAFSQWRTSWLSREGVLAVATFVPGGIFAIGWVCLGSLSGPFALAALLTIILAVATVYCTGMIYQSLPTIRAWHQPLVSPIYVALALATGSLAALLVLSAFGVDTTGLPLLTAGLLGLAALLKRSYWATIDAAPRTYTAGDATGLGRFGDVRPLEESRGQGNFVMREMGYQIARKHAAKLRRIALGVGLLVPAALVLLMPLAPPVLAMLLVSVAFLSSAAGIFTERWLFFAEAQHVVTVFFGAKSA